MSLRKLSDKNLHENTLSAAKRKVVYVGITPAFGRSAEAHSLCRVWILTLQKYVMRELGYSEAESWTRIQAMKLIRTSELAEEKIAAGSPPFPMPPKYRSISKNLIWRAQKNWRNDQTCKSKISSRVGARTRPPCRSWENREKIVLQKATSRKDGQIK